MPRRPLTIAICPNAFKGTLTASEAADCIERGFRRALPTTRFLKIPFADGGDGTAQAIADATGGKMFTARVRDPLGRPIRALWALTGDRQTAIIEMALASGLALLKPAERRPMHATSFGTGELIRAALDRGVKNILIGIGGSATTDGATGIARALGIRFLDASNRELPEGGGSLVNLAHIDMANLDPRILNTTIRVACDVSNPLYGPRGAAQIYARQNGASPAQVKALDQSLRRLAQVIKRDLGKTVASLPGAGAAGGAGAGLVAFLGATLQPGALLVADTINLHERLKGSDLIITGEGRLDAQTAHGKAPAAIAQIANGLRIPAIALCGSISADAARPNFLGFHAVFPALFEQIDIHTISGIAADSLERSAYHAARLIGLTLKPR